MVLVGTRTRIRTHTQQRSTAPSPSLQELTNEDNQAKLRKLLEPRPLVLPELDDLVGPDGKPHVIFLIGGAGPHGFWQAGAYAGLRESLNPTYYSVASAGTFTGLALAAGLTPDEIYRLIVKNFDERLVQRAQWGGVAERFNLDLGGFLTMRGVRDVVGELLDYAQISGFSDLGYRVGEARPHGAESKVGISVTVWKSKWNPGRRYSPEELQDPIAARRIFREHLWRWGNGPLFNTFHVELPHDLHLFPELSHDPDLQQLDVATEISCSQMFVTLPKIVQDPNTLDVLFVSDGAHVLNMPSRYARGPFFPDFPLMAARLEPIGGYGRYDLERILSGKSLKYGVIAIGKNTFPRLTVGDVMNPDRMTPELREQLFETGYAWGRTYGAAIASRLPEWYRDRISEVQRRARLDRERHGLEVDPCLEYPVGSASPLWHQTAPLGKRSGELTEVSPCRQGVMAFGDLRNPHFGYSMWGGNF